MTKKLTIGLAMIIIVSLANAQTGIFTTYDDYVNGNLEKKEDVEVSGFMASIYYKFTAADGTKVTLKPKEFWGFMFKGRLFRSVRGCTAMLQDSGMVCYYVNGEANTDMLHYNRDRGLTFASAVCYLSSGDMNAKMYAVELYKPFDKNAFKQFKKDFPDYDLYDCITTAVVNRGEYQQIRECVQDFNKANRRKVKK